jgi:Ser/Thr protein kinase RdoA (MazF antagonist)
VPVTYGPIYGDGLQLRVDGRDGSIGLIDWGTVCRGPLLFDLALAAHHAGQVDLSELWAGYLAVGPLQPAELAGLRHYEALMWARSAKYFAFRLEHRVRLGDARRGANQAALARAVSALQRLLGVEGGFAPLESL